MKKVIECTVNQNATHLSPLLTSEGFLPVDDKEKRSILNEIYSKDDLDMHSMTLTGSEKDEDEDKDEDNDRDKDRAGTRDRE